VRTLCKYTLEPTSIFYVWERSVNSASHDDHDLSLAFDSTTLPRERLAVVGPGDV